MRTGQRVDSMPQCTAESMSRNRSILHSTSSGSSDSMSTFSGPSM